jgi:hypothetical protein
MQFSLRAPCALILLFPITAFAQVLISRRVYQEHGPSYQQIWNYNPANGALQPLTHSARNHFKPTCSSKATIFFVSSQLDAAPQTWSFSRSSGAERLVSKKALPDSRTETPSANSACSASARAGDLLACAQGREVVFMRNQAQIARVRVAKHDLRIGRLTWSPSRQWLLVDASGQNSNSSSPQSDYYAVDVVSRKTIPAGSGNSAVWVPGKTAILYTTPRELSPLSSVSGHSVWVSHVVSFDPTTKQTVDITSGLTNDTDLAACSFVRE